MKKPDTQQKARLLIEMTSAFCKEYVNDEYLQLCVKLIQHLADRQIVPFERGKPEIWAAGIIHALGTINFLFDPAFEPYINPKEINTFFGTKPATVSNKSREIRNLLHIGYYNSDFSTQHMTSSSPFNNLVLVDGLFVPIEVLPENLQAEVREARAQGQDIEFYTQ